MGEGRAHEHAVDEEGEEVSNPVPPGGTTGDELFAEEELGAAWDEFIAVPQTDNEKIAAHILLGAAVRRAASELVELRERLRDLESCEACGGAGYREDLRDPEREKYYDCEPCKNTGKVNPWDIVIALRERVAELEHEHGPALEDVPDLEAIDDATADAIVNGLNYAAKGYAMNPGWAPGKFSDALRAYITRLRSDLSQARQREREAVE
jgi:hypothetical protein